MIKRILVISLCIAALVVALVVPASAAVYDYNDLVTNVVVDGDNDLVTVSVPVDNNRFNIRDVTAGTRNVLFGNNVSHSVVADHTYIFEIAPGYSDRVLLDGIPEGTLLKYTVDIDKTSWGYIDVGQMSYSSDIYYLDSNGSFVGSTHKDYLLEETPTYVFLAPLENIPSNAFSFATFLNLHNFSFVESRTISLTVVSCEFQMSISSLYRLQQQTGKTNTLLKEVEKKLADQGQTLDEVLQQQQQTNDKLDGIQGGIDDTNDKLDDIINGTVDPSAPFGGGVVGDLDDAESGIRDDAQSGLDQGLQVQQSALRVVLQYASAFACVGWIFNKFADIPFFSGLLYVSLALGIYGAILGIGLSLSRSGSRAGDRSGKAKGKGG